MSIKSLRDNPFWSENSTYQKDGLIDMVNFIKNADSNLSSWLEVGSYMGESAEIFLSFDFIKELYCIDVWTSSKNKKFYMDFSEETDQEKIKSIFFYKLEKDINTGRCVPIESTSLEAFEKLNKKFDVIYVDACHSYEYVLLDLFIWYTRLNVNGFMCGHDFIFDKNNRFYDSTRAIQDFISFITPYYGTHEFHSFKDGSWLFKKESHIPDIKKYKSNFDQIFRKKIFALI